MSVPREILEELAEYERLRGTPLTPAERWVLERDHARGAHERARLLQQERLRALPPVPPAPPPGAAGGAAAHAAAAAGVLSPEDIIREIGETERVANTTLPAFYESWRAEPARMREYRRQVQAYHWLTSHHQGSPHISHMENWFRGMVPGGPYQTPPHLQEAIRDYEASVGGGGAPAAPPLPPPPAAAPAAAGPPVGAADQDEIQAAAALAWGKTRPEDEIAAWLGAHPPTHPSYRAMQEVHRHKQTAGRPPTPTPYPAGWSIPDQKQYELGRAWGATLPLGALSTYLQENPGENPKRQGVQEVFQEKRNAENARIDRALDATFPEPDLAREAAEREVDRARSAQLRREEEAERGRFIRGGRKPQRPLNWSLRRATSADEVPQSPRRRKFGIFGPSHDRHGKRRTETLLEQGARHHPILSQLASSIGVPLLGSVLGGPLGAVVGGAGYGGVEHGPRGIVPGAMKGAAYASIAPTLGNYLGVDPTGVIGQLTGLDKPSLLYQLGVSSAPAMGGGLGLPESLQYLRQGKDILTMAKNIRDIARGPARERRVNPGGISESVEGGKYSHGDFTPYGIPTTEGKRGMSRTGHSPLEILRSLVPRGTGRKSSYDQLKKLTPYSRLKQNSSLKGIGNPKVKRFKDGGYVEGFSGGTTDDVPMHIPPGAYVMDATTVSLYGDGNSNNGAKKFQEMEHKVFPTQYPLQRISGPKIKALLSDGEYIIPREVVDALGKGDNAKGAQWLDKFRNNLRKQKGLKKFLPPKSKPIENYIRS